MTSYGELAERSRDLATTLDPCIRCGDRVMLAAEPSVEWVVGFFGILAAGGIVVPVDERSTSAELSALVSLVGPVTAIVRGTGSDRLVARLTMVSPESVIVSTPSAGAERTSAIPRLLTRRATNAPHSASPNDVAVIAATSGTTGSSKGAALSAANLAYVVDALSELHAPSASDTWLSVLPLSHLLGISCSVLPALRSGGRIHFADTLDTDELLRMMNNFQVTRMMAVPTLLAAVRRCVARGSSFPPSLTTLYCGGAPVDDELVRFFVDRGVAVYTGYGMTEASPTLTANSPAHSRPGSVGRALPGTEIRIDPGGEILARGPGVMTGYWADPVTTSRTLRDGWLHTGDLGWLDPDGYLFVHGRQKTLIVLPNGLKVNPEEVEAAIRRDLPSQELCVVGTDSVIAVVATTAGAAADDHDRITARIRQACLALSPHKRPSAILLHPGPLPRTPKQAVNRASLLSWLTSAPGRPRS